MSDLTTNGTARAGSESPFTPAITAKLATYGLTPEDALGLRWHPTTAEEGHECGVSARTTFGKAEAFTITIDDLDGNPTDYKQVRVLDDAVQATKPKKDRQRKFSGPTGVGIRPYFPSNLPSGRTWPQVADDSSIAVAIVEGPGKAACMNKAGVTTIGITGCSNYRNRDGLLEDLRRFNWKGRIVAIVMDFEPADKPQVTWAGNDLARILAGLGADVRDVKLPDVFGDGVTKTGADDVVTHRGAKALIDAITEADEFEEIKALSKISAEHIYLRKLSKPYSLKYRLPKSTYDFLNDTRNIKFKKISADGKHTQEVHAGEEWLAFEGRPEANGIGFEPLEGFITEAGDVNAWRGFTVEPKQGDITPWVRYLDHISANPEDPAEAAMQRRFLEQWPAYALQHPGTKLFTAIILQSETEGSGKSLYGEALGSIYGSHFKEVTQKMLHRDFNSWQEFTLLALGNEIVASDKRGESDYFKNLITQKTYPLHKKYMDEILLPDRTNWIFTSNNPNAMYLNDHSRRFFVVRVMSGEFGDENGRAFVKWFESEEGRAALLYHLLHVDLTGFSPTGKAPHTAAKTEMENDTGSELDRHVRNWINEIKEARSERPESERSKPFASELFTLQEVLAGYDPSGLKHLSDEATALRLSLKRHGAMPVRDNDLKIRVDDTKDGRKRLWAADNTAFWRKLAKTDLKEVARLFNTKLKSKF